MSPPSGSLPSFFHEMHSPLHSNSTTAYFFPHWQQPSHATLECEALHPFHQRGGTGRAGPVVTFLSSQLEALGKHLGDKILFRAENNCKDHQVQSPYWWIRKAWSRKVFSDLAGQGSQFLLWDSFYLILLNFIYLFIYFEGEGNFSPYFLFSFLFFKKIFGRVWSPLLHTGLSLVAASGGHPSSQWLLLLQSTGPRARSLQ